jgi:hypothetical protein
MANEPTAPKPRARQGSITREEVLDRALAEREAFLQTRECPFCKSKTWNLHREIFVAARLGKTILPGTAVPAQISVYATNRDMAYRADCTMCGFIALFLVATPTLFRAGSGQMDA